MRVLLSTGFLSLVLLAGGGCTTITPPSDAVIATAPIRGADGQPAGSARMVAHATQLVIEVNLSGLEPGTKGMHLHTVGACDGPGFSSAGGHLNPHGHEHGTMNPKGSHLGDLPNIAIAADGTGKVSITLPGNLSTLKPILFDADGTAIVIHAGEDDYRTDPAGNAGSRIACGTFISD